VIPALTLSALGFPEWSSTRTEAPVARGISPRSSRKFRTSVSTVNDDGTITVNGKTFNSPSRAGKEITGREVDGWTFWKYEVPGVGLKKLDTLRKEIA
jgi:hypothetical protein